ncbi:MAG: SIMPL domain-containing protein [Paramuribaculum sp.]|nr:SIMPL domain-containing protein [Paramuribaculum sp.]
MKKIILTLLIAVMAAGGATAQNTSTIVVTGTATLNIIPDRITVEIGLEEYYRPKKQGADSTKVKLSQIEKEVRGVMAKAGIADTAITTSNVGNYRDRTLSRDFLMAKTISAVLTDFAQLDALVADLPSQGISSFNLTRLEHSDMPDYNRRGLKAALDAAKEKAQFIADEMGMQLMIPWEVVENGPTYYESPSMSNVSVYSGAGMDNMRRITRRYSVKVAYLITTRNQND